jgi:glycosyltransferase involved in cell wall biosynthesis
MDKIKVLVIPRDKETKNTLRVVKPHLYLQESDDKFFVDINYDVTIEDEETLKSYDIVIYHEFIDGELDGGTFAKKLKELNIVGILDIDDNWGLYKNSQFYKYVKHQELAIKEVIRNSDHIITSNEVMRDKLQKVNPKAYILILRDSVDSTDKQYNKETSPSDRLRLGLVVNDYNLADVKILEGLVTKLKSAKLLDKVQFVLCGFHLESYTTQKNEVTGEKEKVKRKPEETVFYQYERILTDNYQAVSDDYREFLKGFLNTDYPTQDNEPYKRVWSKPTSKQGEYYAEFDVTLAPLDVNPFNETITPYRLIESGTYSKPIIAQNYGEYKTHLTNAYESGGTINTEANALLVDPKKNHKEWFKFIKKMVMDQTVLPSLGDNLNNIVKNKYSIEDTTEIRKKYYEKVVKKGK